MGRDAHPAVPLTPDELARDAHDAVAAGAGALHVHARRPDGGETLDPDTCAAALRAIRAACPGVPVGTTTALSAEPSAERRLALVQAWTELPDFVSVNVSEPGGIALCTLLRKRGIGIEAGLWTRDDAATFLRSGIAGDYLRVLVEPTDAEPEAAVATARAIDDTLRTANVALPQVHHGNGRATWVVLAAALGAGHDIRIGLEDTTVRSDGTSTSGNAELVSLAVAMAQRHGRTPHPVEHETA